MPGDIAAGDSLRDRFGSRNPGRLFGLLGVGLVAGGLFVPTFETLLFVWGGTALFVTLLLRFVMTGDTLSSRVTTEIYATLAGNARRDSPQGGHRYVPNDDGVALVVGDRTFDAAGERLLAASGTVEPVGQTDESSSMNDRLSVLTDVLVNDLELATRVRASIDGDSVTVTVVGSRVGTAELFDHPVASVVGVGLARGGTTPIGVETTVDDGALVISAKPV